MGQYCATVEMGYDMFPLLPVERGITAEPVTPQVRRFQQNPHHCRYCQPNRIE